MTQDSDNARRIAREEIRGLFFRLGYDLSSPEDMRKLEKDIEWASRKRSRGIANSVNVGKVVWLILTAFLGSAATALVEWARLIK